MIKNFRIKNWQGKKGVGYSLPMLFFFQFDIPFFIHGTFTLYRKCAINEFLRFLHYQTLHASLLVVNVIDFWQHCQRLHLSQQLEK